jgi:urease accessory protein UreH
VQAGFEPLLKSWKSMTEAHQTEMYHIYTKLGEQAAQQYRERLDNVSNQWMLATVTSLDHQSRDAVARIAVSAEERLRETCTKVFADIGDSLRERLKEISSNLNIPAKGTTPSEP